MDAPATAPLSVSVGRLAWLILCPWALIVITLIILMKSRGWLTLADAAFFVVLGLALLGRWLEHKGGDARTAYGEPATRQHLIKYLIAAPIAGLSVWVLANVLGNHVLPPS